jgi:transcriptional regulator with XRE-family HTH domain
MFDQHAIGVRLKELRESRGLSMRGLASKADVAVSFISKIEGGKASPTLTTLVKLLETLGVSVPEFFAPESRESQDLIVTKHDTMRVLDDGDKCWRYLFPNHPDVKLVMTYEEYRPHTRNKEPESHQSDICGIVLEGVLSVELADGRLLEACKGDSFYIRAGTVHTSSNRRDEKLLMAVAELPIALKGAKTVV